MDTIDRSDTEASWRTAVVAWRMSPSRHLKYCSGLLDGCFKRNCSVLEGSSIAVVEDFRQDQKEVDVWPIGSHRAPPKDLWEIKIHCCTQLAALPTSSQEHRKSSMSRALRCVLSHRRA